MIRSLKIAFFLVGMSSLASYGLAQSGPEKDVQLGAISIQKAVVELEKIYGVQVRAIGSVKSDVVFLNATDVTFAEVREKLAGVLNAEWRNEGDTWSLIRTVATEKAEWNQINSAVEKKIKKSLAEGMRDVSAKADFTAEDADAFLKAMRNPRSGPDAGQQLDKMINSLPGGRAVIQVLNWIPASEIAKTPVGGRAVFSTKPTRVQGAIPLNVMPIAEKLVKENAVFQDAAIRSMNELNPGPTRPDGITERPVLPSSEQGTPSQVMVILTRSGNDQEISATMTVVGADGATLASGFYRIPLTQESEERKPLEIEKGKQLDFSPFTRLIGALKNATASGAASGMMFEVNINGTSLTNNSLAISAGAGLTAEDRNKLRQPDKFEPLNLIIGPALDQVASIHGLDMIGWLPDNIVVEGANAYGSSVKDSYQFLESILVNGDLEGKLDEKWVTFTPRTGPSARLQRIDRNSLGVLLRSIVSKGTATLTEQALYAITSPEADPRAFDAIFGSLLAPEAMIQVLSGSDRPREVLRLFGLMTPNQRVAILNNQRISYGELPVPAKTALNQLVYWSQEGPRSAEPPRNRRNGMMFTFGGGPPQDFATERTVVLDKGIPNEASIGLGFVDELSALVKLANGNAQAMSARQIALNKLIRDQSKDGSSSVRIVSAPGGADLGFPEMTGYKPLNQTLFSFDFLLAQNYGMRRDVSVQTPGNAADFVPFEKLPETFLEMINKFQAEMRKQMGGGRPGGSTESTKPGA